jgi:hypothetical protein
VITLTDTLLLNGYLIEKQGQRKSHPRVAFLNRDFGITCRDKRHQNHSDELIALPLVCFPKKAG